MHTSLESQTRNHTRRPCETCIVMQAARMPAAATAATAAVTVLRLLLMRPWCWRGSSFVTLWWAPGEPSTRLPSLLSGPACVCLPAAPPLISTPSSEVSPTSVMTCYMVHLCKPYVVFFCKPYMVFFCKPLHGLLLQTLHGLLLQTLHGLLLQTSTCQHCVTLPNTPVQISISVVLIVVA